MNSSGAEAADLLVRARSVLLDALDGLREHIDAIIVIGAQAVYLRTGGIDVALAEATKDSDVAVDPRLLADVPRLEAAMRAAGFLPSVNGQPGAWISLDGIPSISWCPKAWPALALSSRAFLHTTQEQPDEPEGWKQRSLTSMRWK